MPTEKEIRCIRKQDRYSPTERITHVGGVSSSGWSWRLTQEEAVSEIERKVSSFFVQVGFNRVDVIVATAASGRKYLRTKADGEAPNNLLSLPECP